LDCNIISFINDEARLAYLKQLDENTAPDIFKAYFGYLSFEETVETGGAREIPWGMIETHAPRYAALIGNDTVLKEQFSTSGSGTYVLTGLTKKPDMLGTYSVYRLDWLEKFGIKPPGEISQLSENIFFTESAYNIDEFISIMEAFSDQDTVIWDFLGEMNTGLAPYYLWSSGNDTLMGLFGANWSNVNENGSAVFYGASSAFESFLIFYESMIYQGLARTDMMYAGDMSIEWVGWWNVDLSSQIFSGNMDLLQRVITMVNNNEGNWKDYSEDGARSGLAAMNLLITPPEINPSGMQRVNSADPGGVSITENEYFMIGANVSDEKLAKILEIFDAVCFDPEVYVMVNYGFEGEDFNWAGEPYESYVEAREIDFNDPEGEMPGYFAVKTMDGIAGKLVYTIPDNALARFAFSRSAREMNFPPYKSDPLNSLADDPAAKNFNELNRIAKKYHDEIIFGQKSVADTWDDYIAELTAAGLNEYNELINKYPKTNN